MTGNRYPGALLISFLYSSFHYFTLLYFTFLYFVFYQNKEIRWLETDIRVHYWSLFYIFFFPLLYFIFLEISIFFLFSEWGNKVTRNRYPGALLISFLYCQYPSFLGLTDNEFNKLLASSLKLWNTPRQQSLKSFCESSLRYDALLNSPLQQPTTQWQCNNWM